MSIRLEVQAVPPYHFTARPYKIKLDQNESPYDLPTWLKARVQGRLAGIPFNRYPEMQAESLRKALERYYDWPEQGIVVSGGSNILIQAFVAACGIGHKVLSVTPTFAVYGMQAKLLGADLIELPLNPDFSLPLERLREELSRGQGVFFLANPAAPTGNLFSEAQLRVLIEAANHWTIVLDEAYHQFSGTDFSKLARDYPHVASLRTFSKAFGLSGVRLGYLLADPRLAEQISKLLLPFSVSALQLVTGLTVLEDPGYIESYIDEVTRERARMTEALRQLEGVTVHPTVTNFLLFKVADAAAFYDGLLEQGVLVRRQDHLPGLSGCLRVSVGTPEENEAFIQAAEQVSKQLPPEVEHG